MKNYQNQLDRFCTIAKRLVDEHSAQLFTTHSIQPATDAYTAHLDTLGRQLDEQANEFIVSVKTADELRAEVWNVCQKYLEQFVKRNQPD